MIEAVVTAMMNASFNLDVLSPQIAYAAELSSQQVWMNALAQHESGSNCTLKILDTNDYYSYGKYQYQMATWLKYSKLFGTTKQNIYSCTLQDAVTKYILDTKGSSDWYNSTLFLEKTLGSYPSSDATSSTAP